MATNKTEVLKIEGEPLKEASYATYFNRLPLFTSLKIINAGEEDAEGVTASVSGSTPLIIPSELSLGALCARSAVAVEFSDLLNPKYLAELENPCACTVQVTLSVGGKAVNALKAEVRALPIDCWGGLSGNIETLASFVRPKLADCRKILTEAERQLKKWGYTSGFSYSGNGKNEVRLAVAAIFSAIRSLDIERAEGGDFTRDVRTGDLTRVAESKRCNLAAIALFAASCAEAARLNPVILIGKNRVGVGVWLYESCFSSAAEDDTAVVAKYVSEGVNNLAIFDADDLFAHRNASFTTSAEHVCDGLRADGFELCLDVKRCRIGGISPLPVKVKTAAGYEILRENEGVFDERPQKLADAVDYSIGGATRERTWLRRLLDLSQKNNLLNFRYGRDCLHIVCADADGLCRAACEGGKFEIIPDGSELAPFGGDGKSRSLRELISIELKSGKMRAAATSEALREISSSLIRRAKSAEEEAGARTLYLAAGFLKWKNEDEKEEKFAPVALVPVTLKKVKNRGIYAEFGDGYEVNYTLLEFLKRQFEIDARGLDGKGLSLSETLAVIRSATANMHGWEVYGDVYIAQFTFARYAMWADVKNNIGLYSENPIISSLLSGVNQLKGNRLESAGEDDTDPAETLTPLPCDGAQFSAVAESARGTTFVLHGPPGTGKSQTITNIIANSLAHGKRVLFVAEKQAALQVVKKRLDEIGAGDFCLELYSGKTADKSAIIDTIENALSLSAEDSGGQFEAAAAAIVGARSALRAPFEALHKKRAIGVSVYEGILQYLSNKSAPEIMNVGSAFYDSLTAEKLENYESMLLSAQAAAKECGGVYRSPFAGINATSCDETTAKSVVCAAEVMLAELKRFKNYLGLFLSAFNQKIPKLTEKKFASLVEIATVLKSRSLDKFFGCGEGDFYVFYNACERYDREVKRWLSRFKSLPDVGKYADDIGRELENWGENYRSSRLLLAVIKRINKCGREPLKEGEELAFIKCAYEIGRARADLTSATDLAQNFTGIGGGINDRKRAEFLKPLRELHSLCAETFADYNADAFNSACCSAASGAYSPLVSGLISAAESFSDSREKFAELLQIDLSQYADCDIFEIYPAKCAALIDNIDMLAGWCSYKATAKKLNECGLSFMTDAIESGAVSGKQILSSFRKNVYLNFVRTVIPSDSALSGFSAAVLDETAANLSRLTEEFSRLTRLKIRADVISRMPRGNDGPLSAEIAVFRRSFSGNRRGYGVRELFSEIPALMKAAAPCVMMSPVAVSQYLPAATDLFDLVIFDEASQMPTCDAVPALARASAAIVVGDPNQMPPTSFFECDLTDRPEGEDPESVLDDFLALGVPEKRLVWHYRSKHESLIAFSDVTYYSSRLCTFPSPDALDSKVRLRLVENGVYDRGKGKCNVREAEALADEVIRRLQDENLRRSSIGVVTFSAPQQLLVERLLAKKLAKFSLEDAAYEREEPLFVKNLENVQGDERDVVLFSVCYGPDRNGKVSLNFGPLNRYGGWRRLNVAVTRAREEMLVFSSMRYTAIDLSRTVSRGVAGLRSFLEFAEKGTANIPLKSGAPSESPAVGKYIAEELSAYGYDCRCNLGASAFKIDVAVVNPKDKRSFILAILCDGKSDFSVKDRAVMQAQTLKRNNWNVLRVYTINFFNNPKREIKKIKDVLDGLTGADNGKPLAFRKPYRAANCLKKSVGASYILGGADGEIIKVIKAVVAAEGPISQKFLIKRTLSFFGVPKAGVKTEAKIRALAESCGFYRTEMLGAVYYSATAVGSAFDKYRVEEGEPLRYSDSDFTPYDVISLVKAVLLNKVSVYSDELAPIVLKELKVPRATEKLARFVHDCVGEGVRLGVFVRSVSDKISLA